MADGIERFEASIGGLVWDSGFTALEIALACTMCMRTSSICCHRLTKLSKIRLVPDHTD